MFCFFYSANHYAVKTFRSLLKIVVKCFSMYIFPRNVFFFQERIFFSKEGSFFSKKNLFFFKKLFFSFKNIFFLRKDFFLKKNVFFLRKDLFSVEEVCLIRNFFNPFYLPNSLKIFNLGMVFINMLFVIHRFL